MTGRMLTLKNNIGGTVGNHPEFPSSADSGKVTFE